MERILLFYTKWKGQHSSSWPNNKRIKGGKTDLSQPFYFRPVTLKTDRGGGRSIVEIQ